MVKSGILRDRIRVQDCSNLILHFRNSVILFWIKKVAKNVLRERGFEA